MLGLKTLQFYKLLLKVAYFFSGVKQLLEFA